MYNGLGYTEYLCFPFKISSIGFNFDDQDCDIYIPEQIIKTKIIGLQSALPIRDMQESEVQKEKRMSIIAYCRCEDGLILGCDSIALDINDNMKTDEAVKYFVNKETGIAVIIAGYLEVSKKSDKSIPLLNRAYHPVLDIISIAVNKMTERSIDNFLFFFHKSSNDYDMSQTQLFIASAFDNKFYSINTPTAMYDSPVTFEELKAAFSAYGATPFSAMAFKNRISDCLYPTSNSRSAALIVKSYIQANIDLEKSLKSTLGLSKSCRVGGDIHIFHVGDGKISNIT